LHNTQFNGKGPVSMIDPTSRAEDKLWGRNHETYYSTVSQVDPFRVIWRRLWIIVLAGLALTGVVTGFSFYQTPTYEASIKLLIGQKPDSDATDDLANEVQGLQGITSTMVEAVNTRPVAYGVIRRADLAMSAEAFQENLSVEQIADTQFIEVSYKDSDPERAQRVANAVGEVFSDRISEISPSANAIAATVWEPAVVPDSPVSPNPIRNAILALVLGLMIGLGLAFLLDYLDDDWKSPEEVEAVSGVPTFGVIPTFKVRKNTKGGS
jgi:capsular polysaccharide biosynthesis protein